MSTRPMQDQVAVVTGGGKGLGRAFALHLASLGATVVVNNRNREVDEHGRGPADHVAAEIEAAGGTAVADHGAVEDPATATRLVETALERFGRLDACITSAGISSPQMFHSTTPENLAAVLDVNVTGTALVASAALRAMREARRGRILLVASTAGLHGEPTVSAYAASKGAVIALGRTAAVEGERRGVHTNVLLPYATTQMTEAGMDPRYAKTMTSESVAPIASALLDPRSTLNGQVLVAGAGGLRVADSVERGTVLLPDGPLTPAALEELVAQSRAGESHTYREAQEAFQGFAADLV
ncbi:NAD(P)-dependent dehydrogenase (short-subunit alcohol dehydrogenase family) [Mumia flava]|uniref:NAD(P)-dependent dehydrogenase (Short-subunit alcohol dehydrogenase family) n=1 Tax=Mumia flava TaxID=1348852 RepID=A0A0B2BEM9_9ACTN|nr:SDR family NAD(P)-dependent oxidoreductase [Mumia flava]PJJ57337.1 NAD(P)-dependent dehydrogenase (short-subunit alcohol dehydrogenase family) [Mumia flava]